MKNYYKKTKKEFKKILKENINITYHEWNNYAYKNSFFSSITIMAHEEVESWKELKSKFM